MLNAITAEDDLIDDLVNAPTLTNVYCGHPHLPSVSRGGVVLPPLGDENDDALLEACVAELRRGLGGS